MCERWIVVSQGIPQRELVGQTELSNEELLTAANDHRMIKLWNSWFLQSMHIPTPQGVALNMQALPIGLNRGPITLWTHFISFFDPQQDPDGYATLVQQYDGLKTAETQMRAKDAGIVTASDFHTGPSGKQFS